MIDDLFAVIVDCLRLFPSLLISLVSIIVCDVGVVLAKRLGGIAGLCGCMVVFNVLGNIQVLYATSYEIINMPVLLGSVTLSASFLACDFINEYYGKKAATQSVFLSFFLQIVFFINIILTIGHKPLDLSVFKNFSMQEDVLVGNIKAIETVFFPIPRLLIASYLAYLVSQLSEVWLYRSFKLVTFIKSAYVKHNISLFISSVVVDTLLFTGIALVLLAADPLSWHDFQDICFSSSMIRIICNIVNSFILKAETKLHISIQIK